MSNWWDNLQPSWTDGITRHEGVSGYSADSTWGAHHHRSLSVYPDVDFDVGDPAYRRGLMLLAGVFIVAGVSTCLMFGCLVTWATRRRTHLFERSESPGRTKMSRGRALLLLAVLALAAEASTIGGLSDVEKRLSRMENATEDIVASLRLAVALPDRVNAALSGVTTAYQGVQDSLDGCLVGFITGDIVNADDAVEDLEEGVGDSLLGLENSGLGELADSIEDVNDDVIAIRGVRHGLVWPTVMLCAVLVGVYLYIAIKERRRSSGPGEPSGTTSCAAACFSRSSCCDDNSQEGRKIDCDKRSRWIRALTWVFAFVILLTAAVATTLRTMVNDFCSDLDENLDNVVDSGDTSAVVDPVLDYYTGDCSGSTTAVDAITTAQEEAADSIARILDILDVASSLCDEVGDDVDLMNSSLDDLWDTLDDGAELVSCENIGGLYRSVVFEELCGELPRGLMALLVSCVLLFLLLLLLWVQWTFMLQQKREVVAGNAAGRARDGSATPPLPALPPAEFPLPGQQKGKVGSGYSFRTEASAQQSETDETVRDASIHASAHLSDYNEEKQNHDDQENPIHATAAATVGGAQPDSPPPPYGPRNMVRGSLVSLSREEAARATGTAVDYGKHAQHHDHQDCPVNGPAAAGAADLQTDSPPPAYRPRDVARDSLASNASATGTATTDHQGIPVYDPAAAGLVNSQPASPPPPYGPRNMVRGFLVSLSREEATRATSTTVDHRKGGQHHDHQDGPVHGPPAAEAADIQPDSPPPPYGPKNMVRGSLISLSREEAARATGTTVNYGKDGQHHNHQGGPMRDPVAAEAADTQPDSPPPQFQPK